MGGKTIDYRFKNLTDIWTGDVHGKNSSLIATGLLGSIRWWFEVLVRGLDGKACDPSQHKCQDHKHCVVCELFGCTGWARKFRFQIPQKPNQSNKKAPVFTLRFTELRPIFDQEWALLNCTMRLISDYGAIGGKTVLKPSDEKNRERAKHHKDYGMVQLDSEPPYIPETTPDEVKKYVSTWKGPKVDDRNFAWASLQNFWFVRGKYLARQDKSRSSFNRVLGRPEEKRKSKQGRYWLAGKPGTSKKVFSFKDPARIFGFVKPGVIDHNEMKNRLEDAWGVDNLTWNKGSDLINIIWGESNNDI